MPVSSHKIDGRLLPLILILGLRVAYKNVYIPNLAKRFENGSPECNQVWRGGKRHWVVRRTVR